MIFIDRSKVSFYIIIINFIITLLMTKKGFNILFIIINKFLKRILLILGKVIYNIDE